MPSYTSIVTKRAMTREASSCLHSRITLKCTACGHRMAHRKWKETKQEPSMLPGPAVPGCSFVSFHFLWAILCPQAVLLFIQAMSMHGRHSHASAVTMNFRLCSAQRVSSAREIRGKSEFLNRTKPELC